MKTLARILVAAVLAIPLLAQPQQPQPDMTIDAKTRREVIDRALSLLDERYVFPEKAKEMATAIRAKSGEYESITSAKELARKLTDDLQAVTKDKHLRVSYRSRPIPERDADAEASPEERKRQDELARITNYGFERVERLQGNIGYVDLRGFVDPTVGQGAAGETAAAAMNFLANTDALIFDLRQNGGGSPGMIQLLASYLYDPLEDGVHLNNFFWRGDDVIRQTWTLPYVPGRRFGSKKPVYVLTGNRTFSAAEEFTYDLKNLKRATIVGETTGGGAHPGGGRRINEHFEIWIPMGRAINPITKTNWEGTGVTPDVAVAKEDALKTAQLDALRKLQAAATDPERKQALGRTIEGMK
jgi:C-terminal processing protease CtpA/Prc